MCSARSERPAYPPTRTQPQDEVLNGIRIVDPYRWLEAADSPEVREWTEAQNRFTDAVLGAVPQPAQLRGQLQAALDGDMLSAPAAKGGRLFFLRRRGSQNQAVLCMRPEAGGEERVILDPNTRSARGTTALDWWYASPDGRLVAFGYSEGGDEWSTLHVLAVDSGELLAERIPRTRYASVAWEPDGSGFYYTRNPLVDEVPAGEETFHNRLFYHRLGTDWRQDPLVFGLGRPPQDMLSASLSPCGRFLLVHCFRGWVQTEVYLHDRNRPASGFVPVVEGVDALFIGEVRGDTLYLLTNWQAPRYRLLTAPVAGPHRAGDVGEGWHELIPEQPDMVLQSFVLAGDSVVVQAEQHTISRLFTLPQTGGALAEVPLPALGSVAHLWGNEASPTAYLTWESFTTPPVLYRLDVTRAQLVECARSRSSVDSDAIRVRQVFYRSKDGTRVPMFILHRHDVAAGGDLPTVLTGYGGFNVSRRPAFAASIYPWLMNGGVWALANLRGGSEYGEAWHRAGMLGNKQNVFDDFIAAAEHLIAAGYTNPGRLGIMGGSNGGLLVGAAMTQRPDLFRAVYCGVPLLDMLRYHKFLLGALWVSEYGSPDDPEHFRWLHAYSPYHRVVPGTAYPATYLHTAAGDSRVDPMHARKMAALLQAASGSDLPILLRVEFEVGHGIGKPLAKIIEHQAELWGFMAWQLGLDLA